MRGDHCVVVCLATVLYSSGLLGVVDGSFAFDFRNFSSTSNLILQTPSTVSDGSLRLTDQNEVGRVVYKSPIELVRNGSDQYQADVLSFTTGFKFQIVQLNDSDYGAGDGLAFFMAAQSGVPSHRGGMNLGIASSDTNTSKFDASRRLVAVEFDTFQNSIELGDISNSHIGIDVNCLVSINATDTASPADNPLNFHHNHTFLARIDYFASSSSLEVRLANIEGSEEAQLPSSPTLQAHIDPLSTIFLPGASVYVGLSASSGTSAGGVFIYSWSFSVEEPSTPSPSPSVPAVSSFDRRSTHRHSALKTAGIVCSAVVFLMGLIFCVYWFCMKPTLSKNRTGDEGSRLTDIAINDSIKSPAREAGLLNRSRLDADALRLDLSYEDMVSSTENFHASRKLGRGGYGEVSRGTLSDQTTVVAVKRFIASVDEGEKDRLFFNEIHTVCRIPDHPNLLKLLGWCYVSADKSLLVYRYLELGDLSEYVHGKKKDKIADPNVRMRIVLGVAKGLLHLHEHGVVHRDLKTSNVLLTHDMEAVLCDFGFTRRLRSESGHTLSTRPVGSRGFWAPEIRDEENRHPTEKSDVYRLGVLSLVIACGKHAIVMDSYSIVYWVRQKQQQNGILQALDADLLINENRATIEQQWESVLKLGLRCTERDPRSRPLMQEVVDILTNTILTMSTPHTIPTMSPGRRAPERKTVVEFNARSI